MSKQQVHPHSVDLLVESCSLDADKHGFALHARSGDKYTSAYFDSKLKMKRQELRKRVGATENKLSDPLVITEYSYHKDTVTIRTAQNTVNPEEIGKEKIMPLPQHHKEIGSWYKLLAMVIEEERKGKWEQHDKAFEKKIIQPSGKNSVPRWPPRPNCLRMLSDLGQPRRGLFPHGGKILNLFVRGGPATADADSAARHLFGYAHCRQHV